MYSSGQQPYKFIVTKESVWIEKKSSTSTGLVWDTKIEVACEQALCLGKGWKNQKVREGKRWGPVDTHLGPLFCLLVLVIADHLSERSLSVTWIHWNVINFACKKEVSIIGNTQLLPCTKMLLFSNEFFLWWVDYALEGLVLVEKMWFLSLISYLGVVTCILIFCGYCFWSGWFAVWCKNIHCG